MSRFVGTLTIPALASAPAAGSAGALYYNTTSATLYTSNGTTWSAVGAGSGLSISDTAPVSPSAGDLWWESNTGALFVYYSSQWVEVGGVASAASTATPSDTAPTSPVLGQLWWDSTSGALYIYYGSIWVEVGGQTTTITGYTLTSSETPLMDGTAAIGTSTNAAKADHVHPTDTSRAPTASPSLSGTVSVSGNQAITGSSAAAVQLSVKGAASQSVNFFEVVDSANAVLVNVTSAGTFNVGQGSIIPMVGTASEAPIDFSPGTNLSTASQGAMEFDGNNLFITGDTTNGSGRMVVQGDQRYWLASSAAAITAGTDFFPTGRAGLLSGHLYHFKMFLLFSKNTAGTVTFQLKNSAAASFTYIAAQLNVFVQGAALAAVGNVLSTYAAGAATASFAATGSLANNSNCMAIVDGFCVPAANTRLSIAPSAYGAGTITTAIGSNYIATDLGAITSNYGNFG